MSRLVSSLFSLWVVCTMLATLFCNVVLAEENVLEGLSVKSSQIPTYRASKIGEGKITIDGKLDEKVWQVARKTGDFVDLISGRSTMHKTQSAILWDNENLYFAFWVEEPNVHAKYTKRDAKIYHDNDIEIFVAGKNAYYEFEMNAHGTIYEALVMWNDKYDRLNFAELPSLAKSHAKSQSFNGVGFKTHPRGKRTIALAYDFPDLKSAVFVDGTINDPQDRDRGWTCEVALPWAGMKEVLRGDARSCPPRENDVWRLNLFRFNQYKEAKPAIDSGGWAWSKHSVWDSHVPECFPKVQFTADGKSDVATDAKERK